MMATIGIILVIIGAAAADSASAVIPAIMVAVGLTLCRLASVRDADRQEARDE